MPAGTSPTTTPTRLSSDMATAALATGPDYYVSLSRVEKTYSSPRGPVAALTDINLEIRPREFVSVVGPSGCGKSTLLKLVAGLEDITSGAIHVGGRPLDGPPDGLGVVFQRESLLDWRTILVNLFLSIEFVRKPRPDERARAVALLNPFGTGGFGHPFPWDVAAR